ncbi:MAG: hypothetical protein DA408_07450 [Bacteroidetes bacterium]|nr:MAG: hypothetical protein C7N36_03890 [Bacteroidota bacterium]PTM13219.1 MAG: hypothetical protein DA408_07450 [Bacteroidota bacterium]
MGSTGNNQMRNWWFVFLVLVLCSQSGTQGIARFTPPVRGKIELTGTFGELRSNHFHGGLDIRGEIGRPVYAIADGYVSRIQITVSGYGQALFLEHPSGHTSVYGHLDRFRDDISAYARNRQYAQENFVLEEEPTPDRFPVKQGDLIGFIGARGFVSGPHLHFEIRDTYSGRMLNPLNFGVSVSDHRRPFISGLRLYELDERGRVLAGTDVGVRSLGNGQYRTTPDTLYVSGPSFGLAVKAYDQQDGRPNFNGIYGLELWQNDTARFAYHLDDFAGEDTRYLNAHLDYAEQRRHSSWLQRAFRMPGNPLDIYRTGAQEGRLHLQPGEVAQLRIHITDHPQNAADLNILVSRRQVTAPLQNPVYTCRLPYDEENLIDDRSVRAHFPPGALYEDLLLDYDFLPEQSQGLYSPVHRLHRSSTPLHRHFDLHIRPNAIREDLKTKAIITHCDDGKDPTSYGGEWTPDGRLRAPVRTFGNFAIMVDTTPPKIVAERFGADMRGWDRFSFRVTDNFPTAGKARDLRFRAEVDGHWILLEYDARKNRLYHDFDGRIPPGEHLLVLRVQDDRNNETVVELGFKR